MSNLITSLAKFDQPTLASLEKKLERERLRRLASKDLIAFTEFTFARYEPAPPHRIIAEQLERVERGEVDRLMLLCPPRHGKLCADDTPVLTPIGWRTHGDLQIGDSVYGPDGEPTVVIAVSAPGIADHVVEFTNGERVHCHANHEWTVIGHHTHAAETRETKFFCGPTARSAQRKIWSKRALYALPSIEAAKGRARTDLKIDPYVLGVWLGDGTTTKPYLTMSSQDIDRVLLVFAQRGCQIGSRWVHSTTGVVTVSLASGIPNVRNEFSQALYTYGLLGRKHIPNDYFTASIEQRLALLAGLIDTDGHVCRETGRTRFITGSPELAEDVYRLAASLAFRPYTTITQPTISSSGIVGKLPIHVVGFQPNRALPVVLERKRCSVRAMRRNIGLRRVYKTDEIKHGKCIQVARADGLYLVGRSCIPTHNSELASRRFPAFYLGRHAHKQFISASASATLAEDFGRDVRNLIASEEYAQVFKTRLSDDSQAKGRWSTQQGGSYYAVGVGSQVMGRGAHVFMIDDPFGTMQDAQSEAERKAVWDWFGGTVYNRLEQGGAIVIINHRMHEDDLSGRLLAQQAAGGDQWTVVELKATPEHPLWPEKYPGDVLDRIRANTPARHWSALYEQNPTPDDGSYFNADWLKPYVELPDKRTLKFYGASDYAVTDDGGDWTVHVVVGVDPEDRMYLVDLWRAQATPDVWVESFCDMVSLWKPIGWAEEAGQIKSSVGPWLTRRINERRTYVARIQFPTRGDKAIRSQSIRGRMASRGLYINTTEPWYPSLRAELLSFPVGKHDDQVDALGLIGQIIDKIGIGSKLPEDKPAKVLSTEPGATTVTLRDMFEANERRGKGSRSRIR